MRQNLNNPKLKLKTALPTCATKQKQIGRSYYYSAVRQRFDVIRDINKREQTPHNKVKYDKDSSDELTEISSNSNRKCYVMAVTDTTDIKL
jgi:hypothetical protein